MEQRQKALLEKAKGYRAEASQYQAVYISYLNKRAEIRRITHKTGTLIKRSKSAIRTWARAHHKLKTALEKKQSLNLRELAAAVREI